MHVVGSFDMLHVDFFIVIITKGSFSLSFIHGFQKKMKEGHVALQYMFNNDPSTCERTIQTFQSQHKFNMKCLKINIQPR
jgi:hypothetical protein